MAMSEYVRALRAKVGVTVLEVPTVAILTFDASQRVLLVRHAEGNDWTTPGGMVEPYETPSDAAVREMWEETGLFVRLTRVIGVFGGGICTTTYSNGDKISWVATVFGAEPLEGSLNADGEETLEVRYFARAELGSIRRKPHVQLFLDAGYSAGSGTRFQQPTWTPPIR